jgi:hypothetical protein
MSRVESMMAVLEDQAVSINEMMKSGAILQGMVMNTIHKVMVRRIQEQLGLVVGHGQYLEAIKIERVQLLVETLQTMTCKSRDDWDRLVWERIESALLFTGKDDLDGPYLQHAKDYVAFRLVKCGDD